MIEDVESYDEASEASEIEVQRGLTERPLTEEERQIRRGWYVSALFAILTALMGLAYFLSRDNPLARIIALVFVIIYLVIFLLMLGLTILMSRYRKRK